MHYNLMVRRTDSFLSRLVIGLPTPSSWQSTPFVLIPLCLSLISHSMDAQTTGGNGDNDDNDTRSPKSSIITRVRGAWFKALVIFDGVGQC